MNEAGGSGSEGVKETSSPFPVIHECLKKKSQIEKKSQG